MTALLVWLLAGDLLNAAPARAIDRSSIATLAKPSESGAPWSAGGAASMRTGIEAAIASAPVMREAHVGVLVVETRSGRVLYDRAADEAFVPASTMKLLTGTAALAVLGSDFRFQTNVYAAGTIAQGVLSGDLVLRGGGDPLITATDIEYAAAAVARAGVQSISGRVRVDASYFAHEPYPSGWSIDDIPFDYAAPISAIVVERNTMHLRVTPGARAGDATTLAVSPDVSGLYTVVNRVATGAAGSADTADVSRDDSGAIVAIGSIPAGAAPDTLDAAVPNPERYALALFRERLALHGVRLPAPASDDSDIVLQYAPPALDRHVLWERESAPLASALADFWYPSDNLIGEVLLRTLGVARGGAPGRSASGIEAEAQFLRDRGIDPASVTIADGSGLSTYDRMTPRALVALLQSAWQAPTRDVVLDALPVMGVRGTLQYEGVGTSAERRVFAKTGTLSHARTLAGFAQTRNHGAVTFAFLVDDFIGDADALRALRDRLLAQIIDAP